MPGSGNQTRCAISFDSRGPSCEGHLSRRAALTSLGAVAAAAVLPYRASAQLAPASSPRIDIHHHFYPPDYKTRSAEFQSRHRQGNLAPFVRDWTPERTLEEMDANGVGKAVLSLASAQGVWFDAEPSTYARQARSYNDYGAEIMRAHRGRFELFASLPMPDIDASLKEIAYAFDTLKAAGVELPTSFGDRWPGDPAFAPVYAELNRRKAVVFLHPYAPNCCTDIAKLPQSYLEYPYDTARSALNLLFTGTLMRYRDIRWVFCHGGAAIPILTGRIMALSGAQRNLIAEVAPNGIEYELKRLYYDTANATYPPMMAALMSFAQPSHILFGSDFPYVSLKQNLDGIRAAQLPDAAGRAIDHGNAVALLTRGASGSA